MSKWNRPMRAWTPATILCQTCGQPLRIDTMGWTHARKLLLRDWHPARP